MIKVKLPNNWDKNNENDENYDPPIYDSELENKYDPQIQPRCHYCWATCDDDEFLVHEDQKQINNYYPKQDKLVAQPSYDHPEIDENEANDAETRKQAPEIRPKCQ